MSHWLNLLDPKLLLVAALAVLALALLLVGAAMLWKGMRQDRNRLAVDKALTTRDRASFNGQAGEGGPDKAGRVRALVLAAANVGKRWKEGRYGTVLLAAEDLALLDLCGFRNANQANALFLFARVVLCVGLPVVAILWVPRYVFASHGGMGVVLVVFLGFALGWMLPKWIISVRVARRKRQAGEELPLLVDLLRLLQGVGLSMDQSLHIVVNEFAEVMPVLAGELGMAVDQYTRGRSREQSLARLALGFENDDLSAICRLIAQVDQHGGAVQEPLQRFGERLREQRRLDLKEKVGKLTVKMTGVMVLTLLPALLIVTAGSGFLAVIRGLSQLGGS